MPVSHKHKFIFIHVPKCAGTSIEYLLEKNNITLLYLKDKLSHNSLSRTARLHLGKGQHLTSKDIFNLIGKNRYEEYFKFAIVRNPFDRLVSYYHFIKAIKKPNLSKMHVNLVHTSPTFKVFVKKSLSEPLMSPLFNQHLYTHNEGISNLDFIGKLENLNEDFRFIHRHLSLSPRIHLDKLNKSSRKEYVNYYDSSLCKDVEKACNVDCKLFDYEFGK